MTWEVKLNVILQTRQSKLSNTNIVLIPYITGHEVQEESRLSHLNLSIWMFLLSFSSFFQMLVIFIVALLFTGVGIVLTLIIEWYYFNSWLIKQPQKVIHGRSFLPRYQLPKELKDLLGKSDFKNQKESCVALNLFFQFLFKELKDTKKVRKWFMKKLSVEFEELLQKTTTGKFLERITLKDLNLGTQFPIISNVQVATAKVHDVQDFIEELDILMNIEYSGGFQLSVDADIVLGRSAYLAVEITKLRGQIRLQLTRQPFTHWSISFCQEPVIEFKVESQFQGRPLPQVTSIIISQIRRTIRKKHTLPNYKVRYKPFFEKLQPASKEVFVTGDRLAEGRLEVNVIESSRLIKTSHDSMLYCTLAIDSVAWVELFLQSSATWMTQDIEAAKLPGQAWGITIKQDLVAEKGKQCIVVESVSPESSLSQLDIQKNDILVAINGVKITTYSQTTKLFRQATEKILIRIERRCQLKSSHSQESLSKLEEQVLNLKDVDAASTFTGEDEEDFINMKIKGEEGEGSPSNSRTPTQGSPVRKISLFSAQSNLFSRHKNLESSKLNQEVPGEIRRKSVHDISTTSPKLNHPSEKQTFTDSDSGQQLGRNVNLKRTVLVKSTLIPIWEEKFVFEVEEHHRYLNLGVWCKTHERADKVSKTEREKMPKIEKDILLGHVSIPLLDVAMECATNSQGFHQQKFQLKPPELKPTASRTHKLSFHPGFDETLCYGDITLTFIHKYNTDLRKGDKKPSETLSLGTDIAEDYYSSHSYLIRNSSEVAPHNFLGTQFQNATLCHFCGKKIWFKVAYQCSVCSMICHKKCTSKCQAQTTCTKSGVKLLSQAIPISHVSVKGPEIITTDIGDDQPPEIGEMAITPGETSSQNSWDRPSPTPPGSPKNQRRSIPSLLANITQTAAQAKSGLTRVGSAHNLVPPSQHFSAQSKSLPPSPQYSPLCSRKASLQGNPFCVAEDSESEEDMEATVQRLLQHPNDEMLVSAAKEMGKELYTTLNIMDRRAKLNAMIKKLQLEIDAETENRVDLTKADQLSSDPAQKTKIAFQIAKSDERSRALAVLLLHYYAGIQHCQEIEESTKAQDLQPEPSQTVNKSSIQESAICDTETAQSVEPIITISSECENPVVHISLHSTEDNS